MDFRAAIFKLVIIVGFLLLVGKLFSLTVIAGPYYRELSSVNRLREAAIFANRGIIYDRKKVPLTINAPIYLKDKNVISKEDALLDPSAQMVLGRKYLLASSSAHLLGYLNLKDRTGVGGVEQYYNNWLTGVDGKKLIEVDAAGQFKRDLGQIDPVPGKDLVLTIDSKLQTVVGQVMGGKRGAVVISNYNTGEILALYSGPSYDPNLFTMPGGENWEAKVNKVLNSSDHLMFNRAVAGTYPPGSTFKLVSAVAGLESKSIDAFTKYEDTGVLIIGPYKFPNWKWLKNGGVDGWVDVVMALQKSNDIFFYHMGGKVGIEKLEEMSKKFGLTRQLGIDLPGESAGIFKTDRDWFLGDTYHTAIGQGEILVTPLQVNSWTSSLANGGIFCRPYLNGGSHCKSLELNSDTIRLIKQGMAAACSNGGTAWPLFDLKKKMYCKTGTAEFGDSQNRTHAWLTGFLDDPSIAITVLIEAGGEGSDVAAPVVKEIVEKWLL